MIAICLATRGLVFTEVLNAIEQERYAFDTVLYSSWDMPIPDAQNYLVGEALKNPKTDYLLFVEEDVVLPEGALKSLLREEHYDITFIDYGVNSWSCSAKDGEGEILWAGLGCTLIKRRVFERLEKPWFRTDKSLRLNDWRWIDNPAKYGGHDIWFFQQAKEAGFKIRQALGECRHLKLNGLGKPETNNGFHQVGDKPKISNFQTIGRS